MAGADGGCAGGQPAGGLQTGTVKHWVEEKGFGFISPSNGGSDIFVHRSTLEDGQCLIQGATVQYEAQWNPQRNKYAVTKCMGATGKGGSTVGGGCSNGKGCGGGSWSMGQGMGQGMGQAATVGAGGNQSWGAAADGTRQTGKVKVWYDEKGFGFILPEGGGDDIFVHRHALTDSQGLTPGAHVTFKLEWNAQKGKYLATECSLLGAQGAGQAELLTGGGCGGYGAWGGGARDQGQGQRFSPYGGAEQGLPAGGCCGGGGDPSTGCGGYDAQWSMQQHAMQAGYPGAMQQPGQQYASW